MFPMAVGNRDRCCKLGTSFHPDLLDLNNLQRKRGEMIHLHAVPGSDISIWVVGLLLLGSHTLQYLL